MHDNLKKLMTAGERVLLVGAPGCAKSARVEYAAQQTGRRCIVQRASLAERIDFGGCLIPDTAAGVTRALPLEVLHELRTTTIPTVLFLDDLGQAPMDVQAACMSLFDPGALSKEVLIWGATNRPGDKAGVSALCEPLRSRFSLAFGIAAPGVEEKAADNATFLGSWKDEAEGWCEWAMDSANAPAEVIAWHRSTSGSKLYNWKPSADPAQRFADFRSWATVIRLWNAGVRDLQTMAAAVGKAAAVEFLAFARLADDLPTPDQVWIDPKGAPVPQEASALYLIATMLAGAVPAQHAGQFCQYIDRMPRVFGALAGKDAYRRLGAKLSGNKYWCEWFIKNQELFASSSK